MQNGHGCPVQKTRKLTAFSHPNLKLTGQVRLSILAIVLSLCTPTIPAFAQFPMISRIVGGAEEKTPDTATQNGTTANPTQDVSPEIQLGLRVGWGGGSERRWRGSIELPGGTIEKHRILSLEPDAVQHIQVGRNIVQIQVDLARNYGGIDLKVRGPKSTPVLIQMDSYDGTPVQQRFQTTLGELSSRPLNGRLDTTGNRFQIRRAPGDQLQVVLQQDSLVLQPGQELPITIRPNELGIAGGTELKCVTRVLTSPPTAKLQSGDARVEELYGNTKTLRVGEDGRLAGIQLSDLKAPSVDGVYVVEMALYRKTLTSRIVRAKPVVSRTIQFVVVSKRRELIVDKGFEEILLIDHRDPRWYEGLMQLPQWSGLTSGPLNNGRVNKRRIQDEPNVVLDVGGWQAYPLPVLRVGQPHRIVVEVPADVPQTLGISVVEPNAAGQVVPVGLDSGLYTSIADHYAAGKRVHELTFWPKTQNPILLLNNRDTNRPAAFGKIRILAGPTELPALPILGPGNYRDLLAYFDKPVFAENFGSGQALDTASQTTIKDWNTFYDGAQRLAQYLRHTGRSGAIISIACEGSTLYPSSVFSSTPKYDNGVFASNGQDPVQKDVLKLLLQVFQREGLKLVPAIHFSSPLPRLEEQLRQSGNNAKDLLLLNASGRPWTDTNRLYSGLGPHYNPLSPVVQQEMRRAVNEIAGRYGNHPSFAGLALQLGPNTYAQLPGSNWGFDAATVNRYEKQHGYLAGQSLQAKVSLLRQKQFAKWLEWRGNEMTRLYRTMQTDMKKLSHAHRLYLCTADSLNSNEVQDLLRPRLNPDSHAPAGEQVNEAFLRIGLSTSSLRKADGIIMLRPQRVAPMNRLTSQSVNLRMRTDPAIDEPFDQGDESGYQFFHEAQTKGLPSFDKVSPYGAARTQLRLISTMSPAAEWSRRRFIQALARLDSTTIVDGGWMLPLGQESSLNDIVDVFRRLPPKRFQTVTSNVQTQPVLVRTLQHNSDTYVYVINDSPWPIRANLELEVPAGKLPLSLSQNRRIHTLKRNGLKSIWPVKLKPYDLVGVVFSKSNVSVRSVNVNEQDRNRAVNALTNQWRKVKGKFDRDRNQRVPLTAITNSTFEVVRPNEPLVGWSHGYAPRQQQDGSIQLSKQVGQGSTSLQLMNNGQGILWLRSNQFNSPETARLMISVRIRGNKADRPPPLRIGLDAKRNGQVYYRYKQIRPDPDKKTPHDKWLIYELQMTDLPISGLTDLRIAFDLVAPGMAWIDDVQLFKRWLSKGERQAFLETLASNKIAIQQGRVTDCQRFLESYWPAYIERNAQVERVAQQPDAPAKPANSRPNYFPNFNRLWPKLF